MYVSKKDTYQTNTDKYLVNYTIKKNLHLNDTNEKIYEYGIECTLTNLSGEVLSDNEICYISPNYDNVFELVQILKKYGVFPVHLKELVVDILNMTPTEKAHILSL